MTEHHHHIIISKDDLQHEDDVQHEDDLLTKCQERILYIVITVGILFLMPILAWALGRAWDFECELHSDEHWAKYGYEEEVRQFHERQK